jgi:hypothetical protein
VCSEAIRFWFGVESDRVRSVLHMMRESGAHVISRDVHGGAGKVAWNRTDAEVLAEFREFFYARVKTNPQSNCLVCPREANGPYAIIAQFLATRPDVPVDGRTLRDVIARLLEEGGYAGLVKFIKDHNACPKCEAATVCEAETSGASWKRVSSLAL